MPTDLVDVVRDRLRRHAMLGAGDRVLVALSGGPDSTALLHLLTRLAPEWPVSLAAAHVDHRLRADSGRDADFVRALGRRLGVPVTVIPVEVRRDGSLEEAARKARYAALEAEADRQGAVRIAVGHTADDQAETVLMRLLEGASVRGLAGIPVVRGRVIRPLLTIRRRDLVAELERAGLPWIEDPSNRDRRFLRNRIRHDLLPLLAASGAADTVAGLVQVAAHARETVETIERIGAAELRRLGRSESDGTVLPLDALAGLPREVAAEVLWQAAAGLGARGPWRRWAHRGLARILTTPPPRRPFRLGTVRVEAGSGLVHLARVAPVHLEPRHLPLPGRVELPEVGLAVEARIVPATGHGVPRDTGRVVFDADALSGPLGVRGRRRGDRFHPFGSPAERRLKTFLIDAKVPRWERDRVPLVTAGDRIVWVAGVRRAAHAPVVAGTSRVLELVLEPLAQGPPGQ